MRGTAPQREMTKNVNSARCAASQQLHSKVRKAVVARGLRAALKAKEAMLYTKFVAALFRANTVNVNNIHKAPRRCRATVASTKSQEEKDQQECIVVEAVPAEVINQTTHVTNTQLNKIHIDFDNTEEAYKSKGNIELLRSLLVFKLCTIDVLVEKNKEVS